MPRLPRVYIENSLYYITANGGLEEELFKDERDYTMYLELLEKYKRKYGFKLYSFVLMPHQVTLLLEAKEGATVSMIMHSLTSSYTKQYNNRYERKGHLFRERFKSIIIEKGPNLLDMVSYVHMTPVESGLTADPTGHIYSSHQLYLDRTNGSLTTAEKITKLISLENEVREVLAGIARIYPGGGDYSRFINSVTKSEIEALKKKLHRAGIVGSDEFIEKVKEQLKQRSQPQEGTETGPEAPAPRQKFQVLPALSFSIIVLLSGVGLGLFYAEHAITVREKEIRNRILRERIAPPLANVALPKAPTPKSPLAELDGTEWGVEMKPLIKGPESALYYDKLVFSGGNIESKEALAKGFPSSRYTLSAQKDGSFLWETMQVGPSGDAFFWRGETTRDGDMKGTLNIRPAQGKGQDYSFESVSFKKKE